MPWGCVAASGRPADRSPASEAPGSREAEVSNSISLRPRYTTVYRELFRITNSKFEGAVPTFPPARVLPPGRAGSRPIPAGGSPIGSLSRTARSPEAATGATGRASPADLARREDGAGYRPSAGAGWTPGSRSRGFDRGGRGPGSRRPRADLSRPRHQSGRNTGLPAPATARPSARPPHQPVRATGPNHQVVGGLVRSTVVGLVDSKWMMASYHSGSGASRQKPSGRSGS